jgi:hypothetical protein
VSETNTPPIPSAVSSIAGSTSTRYEPSTGILANRKRPPAATIMPIVEMMRTPTLGAYCDARPADTMIPAVNGRNETPAFSGP